MRKTYGEILWSRCLRRAAAFGSYCLRLRLSTPACS